MDDALSKRGRSLEEAFFAERNAQLIEQRKKLDQMQKTREVLAEISGIRNPKVLDKLVELGISPGVLASLVILPLVEVAWADGHLSADEKKAVMDEAAKGGLAQGSVNYTILEEWLKERPSPKFLQAWIHYIEGLRETMGDQEIDDFKAELLTRAQKVAAASGGILGMSKISPEEKVVLKKMEDAFRG